MENRSTLPPISAILITAANPASPPPTTMILGVAILLHRPSVGSGRVPRVRNIRSRAGRLLEALAERIQADQPHHTQQYKKCHADAQQALLRFVAGNDAPLRREQPDSVGEVPRRGNQANHI